MSVESMIARSGHTLTHQRAAEAERGAAGGRRIAWATLADEIPCWVQPVQAAVAEHYAARALVVSHAIYVAQDIGCLPDDRLVVGSATYLVRGVRDMAGLSRAWRIDAQEAR